MVKDFVCGLQKQVQMSGQRSIEGLEVEGVLYRRSSCHDFLSCLRDNYRIQQAKGNM